MADINEAAVVKAAELVSANFPTSKAVGVKCDVSKEAEVKAMIDRAVQEGGRLDVLVSVLSVLCRSRTYERTTSRAAKPGAVADNLVQQCRNHAPWVRPSSSFQSIVRTPRKHSQGHCS